MKKLTRSILLIMLSTFSLTIFSQEKNKGQVMDNIQNKILNENIYSAIAYINAIGNYEEIAKTYSKAVKKLYWTDKGAKNLIPIGNAGINFLLNKASEIKLSDPTQYLELKAWAKTIAYDIGANTWPGWGDEGITISESEMQAGLQASKLNLRLAFELDKPKDKVAIAHWLMGAHFLAAKKYDDALKSFNEAMEISKSLEDKTSSFLNLGYIGISNILNNDKSGEVQLTEAITSLEQLDTDDSKFYIQQLNTVLTIFKGLHSS